jgi:hypothetical protein
MSNHRWDQKQNGRLAFVEKYFDENCKAEEAISVDSFSYGDDAKIRISYTSVRNKKQVSKQFSLTPELMCSISNETSLRILDDLLMLARDLVCYDNRE